MAERVVVRRDAYFDSVFLMAVSAELRRTPGLQAGEIMLGTPANCALLRQQDFALPDPVPGPTDLIVVLRAPSDEILELAERNLAELLSNRKKSSGGAQHRATGLDGALRELPTANLAVISVPGTYAAYEARKALRAGLHVMLFSDNVALEDEIALKQTAASTGRLLMGPDCGTAIINGVMLGFANHVRRGAIGIVAASGTGAQEVSCLIDRFGSGVSQVIGTGGRDLSERVGALTTLFALDALDNDPDTTVIVVVSKPPAKPVAERVLERVSRLRKPAIVHFVGARETAHRGNLVLTQDLESTARIACQLAVGAPVQLHVDDDLAQQVARSERGGKLPSQRFIRGLFTGGTMGAEALATLTQALGPISSNLHHGPSTAPAGGHAVIDLGDDEFTQGRPHPMIDPSPRVERLLAEADDESVSVVLLDVVLGTGSHPDPAGAMVPAIVEAKQRFSKRGANLSVIASVTGTPADPQGLVAQVAKLEHAGVAVLPSNIQAVRCALAVVQEAHHG